MLVTKEWISENYSKFNNLYWDGKLPNIKFKISHSCSCWGFASFIYDYPNNTIIPETLTISNYYDSPEEVKISTLLHEMIHIADYTFHPEHFIRNHKPIHGRSYNAHGWWFKKECERLRKYGLNVTNHVTLEDQRKSSLSERTKIKLERKKLNAIACVITSDTRAFVFKTDSFKINNVNNTIKKIGDIEWKRFLKGDIKSVAYYKTNNSNWSSKRSCCNRLTGKNMPISYLDNYLDTYNMIKI